MSMLIVVPICIVASLRSQDGDGTGRKHTCSLLVVSTWRASVHHTAKSWSQGRIFTSHILTSLGPNRKILLPSLKQGIMFGIIA
jgi:hypothetical protein